jgi:DNA polymerase-3 subunit delta'
MTTWNNIIGHQWAVEHLRVSIAQSRVGHAYLITGPRQVGKATVARTFAQALNCENTVPEERPCGRCRPCTLIAASRHPDVRIVSGELSPRGKRTIKIDQIREVQQALSLTAAEARRKIALLSEFDTANANAANAFLKTLEEPPVSVILLLTAVDADSLLQTIVSRCRSIGLRPVKATLIAAGLQDRWGVPAEKADLIAQLSDGRPGWAIQAVQEQTVLQQREDKFDLLYEILQFSRTDRFALALELAAQPIHLPFLLQTWLTWWRDLSLISYGRIRESAITNIDHADMLSNLAEGWQSTEILRSLQTTEASIWQLEHNANARLVMENLFLTYPALSAPPV